MPDGMRGLVSRGSGGVPGAVPGGGSNTNPDRIDWPGFMRLGLGALRLPPEHFWSMTPAELCLALEGAGLKPVGGFGMNRATLDRLMGAHPDAEGRSE